LALLPAPAVGAAADYAEIQQHGNHDDNQLQC
jgi:hypothetical protein